MNFVDIKVAAEKLGVSLRHIRRMCEKGELPGSVKKGKRWSIPVSANPKLGNVRMPDELCSSSELLDVPAGKREDAFRKLGMIKEVEQFASAHIRSGGNRTDAIDMYAAKSGVGSRSMKRWIQRYRALGLIGLIDTRGTGEAGFFGKTITPEAFEVFKAMYLTQQRMSLKTCWRNICYVNQSENKGWQVPTLGCMYELVKNQIPEFVQVLHREGLAAYEAKCAPYVQIDPDSIQPGQVWVGDHHQCNCWIRHRGKWTRPWVTAWQDMRSRAIVGRYISASPNQTTILQAMKRGITEYGPPDSVKIDNGRDYDSEMWTGVTKAKRKALPKGYIDEQMVAGIYAMMDISVSFAIPYHPQSKPIERFFDTLDMQFSKTFPTYCGKDSERKPDYLNDLLQSEKAIAAAFDLQQFAKLMDRYLDAYNNSSHSGAGMDGRSPAEVMATRGSRRVVADGVLDLLCRVWSGELTVGKNGVKFRGMWYGQFNLDLMMHQGKKVRVAFDPDDLRTVHAYDAVNLKLITIAEQSELIKYGLAVSDDALREAMQQKSRAVRLARDFKNSRLTANMNLTTLTIRAMQAGCSDRPAVPAGQTIRPVVTPMDGQQNEHTRLANMRILKKAVGAEISGPAVDIDLSQLKSSKSSSLKLFDNG